MSKASRKSSSPATAKRGEAPTPSPSPATGEGSSYTGLSPLSAQAGKKTPVPVLVSPLPSAGEGLGVGASPRLAVAGTKSSLLYEVFGIDLRALAVLRIGMGLLIFLDYIGRSLDLDAHYTEWGVFPRLAAIDRAGDYYPYLSPYMWTGFFPWHTEHVLVGTLFFVSAVVALLMAVGWKTRWTTIATWMLLSAVHTRNPLILHGADDTLRALLFWTMFTPWGARFSLDALQSKRATYGQATPQKVLSLGTAGLLLQIGIIYWFTAALKNGPEWRHTGLAVYYALSIGHYETPVGQFLRQFHPLLKIMTFGAIALETLGPTLVFIPYLTDKIRAVVAPIFIVFHLVLLNLLFDLGPFPYIAALMWVVFLPPFVWDALARSWNTLCRKNPIVSAVENKRAALVAWRDEGVAAYCRKQKPVPSLRLRLPFQIVCGFFIAFTFLWNLRSMNYPLWVKVLPDNLNVVARITRVDQGWGLFAPRPMPDDGWFVMPGKLHDDETVDVFTNRPVTWDKPKGGISGMYRSERWRKYIMNLWSQGNVNQRYYYGRYLCRAWNRDHDSAHQLRDVSLYYMLQPTQPDYSEPKAVPMNIFTGSCTQDDAPGGAANPL